MVTFIKIATVIVGAGGAANIDFSSIPATYTDLKLVVSARTDRANTDDGLALTVNGGGAVVNTTRLYGNGTTSNSNSNTPSTSYFFPYSVAGGNATANVFGSADIYFPNYLSANHKSVSADIVSENNATAAVTGLAAGLFQTTSAISRITIVPAYGTKFDEFSSATLYGIKSS